MKQPRIYLFDIESSPIQAYVWGMYEQDVIKVIRDWHMLAFSVKELGGRQITRTLADYPNYRRDKSNDRELVKEMWSYFDKADILIAHNGDSFDIKKCFDRFSYWGLQPPSPFKKIDTLKIARKHFKFTSNKLNDLGEHLGLGKKVRTGGFDLWEDCMKGDMRAWRLMKKYNAQDVRLLEKVYLKFLPFIDNHPAAKMKPKENKWHECQNCGEKALQSRGYEWSNNRKLRRFQCLSCGHWQHEK